MKILHGLAALVLSLSLCAQAATPVEEANKKIVLAFYDAAFFKYDSVTAVGFLGPRYIQHNPQVADGVAPFKEFIDFLKSSRKGAFSSIKRVLADGDLVALHVHTKETAESRGRAVVDIFRLEDGKIVEHWDVIQAVPEKSANDNTMF